MVMELVEDWMPADEVQARFVGSSGDEAMAEAEAFWSDIQSHLAISETVQGLDVGVGWGRVYRVVSRDVPDLIGVDVDPEAVAMCRKGIPAGRFELIENGRFPLERNSRNFAFLYSVFSHLSEAAFRSTMSELARVIRPGGYVAFTTFHARHLEVWREQYDAFDEWRLPMLHRAGFDAAGWRRRLDAGDLLFVPTGGGNDEVRPSDAYGETIITPAFLARYLPGSGFNLTYFDGGFRHPQAHVVLRRDC